MCMAVLSSPPLPLSSFLISYGSTREFKCREYKGIRNLFAEEGEKQVILLGILQTAGVCQKSHGQNIQSLHSVDFLEN